MPVETDFFRLFGLEPRFAIDAGALESAYRRVQSQVHPDRYAAGSAAEQRVAMQWATVANEAYLTLRSPLKRAAYLCERHGHAIEAESNTAMPPQFLAQQLHWRESLDEAGAAGELKALQADVDATRAHALAALSTALDQTRDHARAAALVRQLMFIEKFATEIAAATDARVT